MFACIRRYRCSRIRRFVCMGGEYPVETGRDGVFCNLVILNLADALDPNHRDAALRLSSVPAAPCGSPLRCAVPRCAVRFPAALCGSPLRCAFLHCAPLLRFPAALCVSPLRSPAHSPAALPCCAALPYCAPLLRSPAALPCSTGWGGLHPNNSTSTKTGFSLSRQSSGFSG